MGDHFVERYRHTCTVTHDAVLCAKETEALLKEVKLDAENLQHDVEIVAKETQMTEDQLLRTLNHIAIAEASLLVTTIQRGESKVTHTVVELQSRVNNLEQEITNAREQMAEKTEKYEQITDFIHQESVEQRCDNKALHDRSIEEDKIEVELGRTLQSAEDYTCKYEEIKKKTITMQKELKKQVDRGDLAEEKVSMREQMLVEKLDQLNEMTIQNLDNSAQEDNSLEDVRQKRESLYLVEQRLEFALTKKAEYDAIANDLRRSYAEEQQKYARIVKQKSNCDQGKPEQARTSYDQGKPNVGLLR